MDSVRSKVTSLSEHLKNYSTSEILQELIAFITNNLSIVSTSEVEPSQLVEVQQLMQEKFECWGWNFGHSPQFEYQNGPHKVIVRKGIIIDVESKSYSSNQLAEVIGKTYRIEELKHQVSKDLIPLINEICMNS